MHHLQNLEAEETYYACQMLDTQIVPKAGVHWMESEKEESASQVQLLSDQLGLDYRRE